MIAENLKKNRGFAHSLNQLPELGPVRLGKLFARFPDLSQAFRASIDDLIKAGIEPKIAERILPKIRWLDPDKACLELDKYGIEILLMSDKAYPSILKEIPSAPPILYIRGRAEVLSGYGIGVVGTRKMTSYGKQVTNELIPLLAQNRINVISGLAFGIDAEALALAIEHGLSPVAVLASSIEDSAISPRSNLNLAKKIIDRGCIISEYPPGTSVQKQNFPQRNRIISGLSVGTLVIEADLDSGALITAKYALEQNRAVFAVPGPIFSQSSRGANDLIRRGAKPVSGISDIIEELNLDLSKPQDQELYTTDDPIESAIIESLTRQPVFIDELVKALKLPVAKVNTALSILELGGRVKNLGNNRYVKLR
jgi:DNA processing protein